jgi:hypothetical protein
LIIKGAKNICNRIGVDEAGVLLVHSRLKPVLDIRHDVPANFDGSDGIASDNERNKILQRICTDLASSNVKQVLSLTTYLCDAQGKILGWTVLDKSTLPFPGSPVFCLALMGTMTRRNAEKERRTGLEITRKMQEYWVLMLQRYEDWSENYVRVGVGKTFGKEWWQDAATREVRLV